MSASTTQPTEVAINGVAIKGVALDGTYPVVRVDGDFVIIRHAEYGALRIPRANTNLPGAAATAISYDDLLNDINERFGVLDGLMAGIIEGHVRSLIVSGAPGVGKTHTIESRLAEAKEDGTVSKYKVVRGTISPIRLYTLLWENRRPGEILVLDDSDSIFHDEDGASIIKAATDSGKKRIISYQKMASSLEANGIPNDFKYEGAVVVATNLDFEREVSMNSKIAVHLGAVLNRALYLDLGLHSKQALMARVEDVCRNTPMLRDAGLDEPQIDALVGWLKDNQATVRSLSLRTAMHVANLIKTAPKQGWKKVAKATCLQAVGR